MWAMRQAIVVRGDGVVGVSLESGIHVPSACGWIVHTSAAGSHRYSSSVIPSMRALSRSHAQEESSRSSRFVSIRLLQVSADSSSLFCAHSVGRQGLEP